MPNDCQGQPLPTPRGSTTSDVRAASQGDATPRAGRAVADEDVRRLMDAVAAFDALPADAPGDAVRDAAKQVKMRGLMLGRTLLRHDLAWGVTEADVQRAAAAYVRGSHARNVNYAGLTAALAADRAAQATLAEGAGAPDPGARRVIVPTLRCPLCGNTEHVVQVRSGEEADWPHECRFCGGTWRYGCCRIDAARAEA